MLFWVMTSRKRRAFKRRKRMLVMIENANTDKSQMALIIKEIYDVTVIKQVVIIRLLLFGPCWYSRPKQAEKGSVSRVEN